MTVPIKINITILPLSTDWAIVLRNLSIRAIAFENLNGAKETENKYV